MTKKYPRARVSVNVPCLDSSVSVRISPPDSHLDLTVSSEGSAIEVQVTPRGHKVEVSIQPPDEVSDPDPLPFKKKYESISVEKDSESLKAVPVTPAASSPGSFSEQSPLSASSDNKSPVLSAAEVAALSTPRLSAEEVEALSSPILSKEEFPGDSEEESVVGDILLTDSTLDKEVVSFDENVSNGGYSSEVSPSEPEVQDESGAALSASASDQLPADVISEINAHPVLPPSEASLLLIDPGEFNKNIDVNLLDSGQEARSLSSEINLSDESGAEKCLLKSQFPDFPEDEKKDDLSGDELSDNSEPLTQLTPEIQESSISQKSGIEESGEAEDSYGYPDESNKFTDEIEEESEEEVLEDLEEAPEEYGEETGEADAQNLLDSEPEAGSHISDPLPVVAQAMAALEDLNEEVIEDLAKVADPAADTNHVVELALNSPFVSSKSSGPLVAESFIVPVESSEAPENSKEVASYDLEQNLPTDSDFDEPNEILNDSLKSEPEQTVDKKMPKVEDSHLIKPEVESVLLQNGPKVSPEASTAVIVNFLEDTDESPVEQEKAGEFNADDDMDIELLELTQGNGESVRLAAKPLVPAPKAPL